MSDWLDELYTELDAWNADGIPASVWWRDDDAQSPSPELDRLLALSAQFHAPLALAVIPHGMDDGLAARLVTTTATVLQHGFAHANHAPAGEKKSELGAHRDMPRIRRELADGFATLRDAFGERFLPVLTPPWNRIADAVLHELVELKHGDINFRGISTFGPRVAAEPAAGIRAVNTHVDVIDWKGGKKFAGTGRCVAAMTAHLRARREGRCDAAEPTGLLTHHLVHDDACQTFLAALLLALDDHPAVKWLSAKTAFGLF